jgi:hypothetical protein
VIAHETGTPIMRSMPLAFPGEHETAATPEQYMFGPDLLVAPVVSEDVFKMIAFPSGIWTSLWNGKTVVGPVKLKVDAPLDTIPVYLKPGAVIPAQLSRELEFGRSMTGGRVHVLVVTAPNRNQNISLLNSLGEMANVTVQTKTGGVFWKLENLAEMSYLLIYGTASASFVKVNGKALPSAASATPGSATGSWTGDPAGNRLVIQLPAPQSKHSEFTLEVDVEFDSHTRG